MLLSQLNCFNLVLVYFTLCNDKSSGKFLFLWAFGSIRWIGMSKLLSASSINSTSHRLKDLSTILLLSIDLCWKIIHYVKMCVHQKGVRSSRLYTLNIYFSFVSCQSIFYNLSCFKTHLYVFFTIGGPIILCSGFFIVLLKCYCKSYLK